VFLHQRKQNPCENAQRFERAAFPLASVHLHTGFLDTRLRPRGDSISHFLLELRVTAHRVRDTFLFDHEYPERTIYSESMEVRLDVPSGIVQYRWLAATPDVDDAASWQPASVDASGVFRFVLRAADTLDGSLCMVAGTWPDDTTEQAGVDAARA
jgi:hypothetical protein